MLHKLDDLELWTVGHPMQRGQQKVLGGAAHEKPDFSGAKDPVKEKTTKRKRKDVLDVSAIGPDELRRSSQGREAIKLLMKNLNMLDEAVFPNEPMFDPNGVCRLNLPGAAKCKWQDLLDIAPDTIECLHLGMLICWGFP